MQQFLLQYKMFHSQHVVNIQVGVISLDIKSNKILIKLSIKMKVQITILNVVPQSVGAPASIQRGHQNCCVYQHAYSQCVYHNINNYIYSYFSQSINLSTKCCHCHSTYVFVYSCIWTGLVIGLVLLSLYVNKLNYCCFCCGCCCCCCP